MRPILPRFCGIPHARLSSRVLLVAIAVVAVVVLAALQLPALLAHLRLQDGDWWTRASPTEIRETAHKALGLWAGDRHEAFVALVYYGDSTSIPYLRRALVKVQAQPDGEECTWMHAQEALDRIVSTTEGKEEPKE